MTSTISGEDLAAWFAFLGKAFLSTDSNDLVAMLEPFRDTAVPGRESALAGDLASSLQQAGSLETEYVRLFLDPAGAPCAPWQSAHAAGLQLMGPAHQSALAWYREAGIEPKALNEPADHAGLLLGFAGSLIASGVAPDVIRAFCQDHLAWIPAFCESVKRETRHRFYALLADAASQAVRELGRRLVTGIYGVWVEGRGYERS